jgi:hypothetical protein
MGNVVGDMGNGDMSTLARRDSRSKVEAIPELRPWRQVGWIFRDGDVLAIERRGDRTRVRSAPVHQH